LLVVLFDEFNFLGWIAARKQIIATRLQGVYRFDEVAAANPEASAAAMATPSRSIKHDHFLGGVADPARTAT